MGKAPTRGLKCENGSKRFQPGEGPSRGLLRDCTTGCGTDGSFYSTNRDRRRGGTSARRRHRSGRQDDPRPEVTKSEPPSPGHSCASERSELLQVSLIVAQFHNMIHRISSSTSYV